MTQWYVYVLYSVSTGHLYTGITTAPSRRLDEHNSGNKGAKATRVGRPWKIVRVEMLPTKSMALKRELQIKALKKSAKLLLVGLSA
jgi:putative endonuclease